MKTKLRKTKTQKTQAKTVFGSLSDNMQLKASVYRILESNHKQRVYFMMIFHLILHPHSPKYAQATLKHCSLHKALSN